MPTIEQLKAEHEGEWLAINVTASDYYGATEGELIYHSEDHDEVWRRVHEILKEKREDCDIKVCYAGPLVSEDIPIAISVWAIPDQADSLSSKTQR